MQTWTLRDRGRDLVVEIGLDDGRTRARLLVDGEEVAAGDGSALDTVRLGHEDLRVRVELLWKGRARGVDLLDHGPDGPPADGDGFAMRKLSVHRVPFAPPPGTKAARRHAWREAHPALWATRHVVIEGGTILVAVLGIGALVSALLRSLLPLIDLGWLPDIDIDPPAWLRHLDPFHWIRQLLPDIDWGALFGWLPDVQLAGWVKYVVILLIAVAAGVTEVQKRRQREAREAKERAGERAGERLEERTEDSPPEP